MAGNHSQKIDASINGLALIPWGLLLAPEGEKCAQWKEKR